MGRRIDKVVVIVDVNIEFEGPSQITFELPPDDPLVDLLLAKNDAMNLAAAIADGPAQGIL